MSLALNSIELLSITNLPNHRKSGRREAMALRRTTPDIDIPQLERGKAVPSDARDGGVPSRPPSQLPEPGHFTLHATLGDVVGDIGRVGTVYKLVVHSLGESPQAEFAPDLPSLVAKVANRSHVVDIEHEAMMYLELECLQGCAVPRCYGYFETEDHRACVLLLEELGGYLPFNEPLSETTIKDVFDIYHDLAHLGVWHGDIRYANILAAPPNSRLPSLPSPFSHRTYAWRVIDFDLAKKTDWNLRWADETNEDWVSRILDNIPKGRLIEPWD